MFKAKTPGKIGPTISQNNRKPKARRQKAEDERAAKIIPRADSQWGRAVGCQRAGPNGPHQDFSYRKLDFCTRSRSKRDVGPFAKANWHPKGGKAANAPDGGKRSGRQQRAAEGSMSSGRRRKAPSIDRLSFLSLFFYFFFRTDVRSM